jgi:hypothetical protein
MAKTKKADTLDIIAPGTEVKLADDVFGKVLAVTIGVESVAYEVGWWSGRSFSRDHFTFDQLTVEESGHTRTIGFG